MPPIDSTEGDAYPGGDHDTERGEARDAEQIDPGRHISRLRIGEELPGRKHAKPGLTKSTSPARGAGSAVTIAGSGRSSSTGPALSPRGNGNDNCQKEEEEHRHNDDQIGFRNGED